MPDEPIKFSPVALTDPQWPGVREMFGYLDGYGWAAPFLRGMLRFVVGCYAVFHMALDCIGIWIVTQDRYELRRFLHRRDYAFSLMLQMLADYHRLIHYPFAPSGDAAASTANSASSNLTIPFCPASAEYRDFMSTVVNCVEQKCAYEQMNRFVKGDDANHLTWTDFYNFRRYMLPLYPKQELFPIVLSARADFLSIAPARERDAYIRTFSASPDFEESYAGLLAHAEYLLRQLGAVETYRPAQELKRNFITYALVVALVLTIMAIVGFGALLGWWLARRTDTLFIFPFFCEVMIVGAVGGAISYQRRLQESFDEEGWILNTTRFVGSGVGVKITPAQGSVFALVLMFLLLSGLPTKLFDVTGNLPTKTPDQPVSISDTWHIFIAGPTYCSTFCELLALGFLAGFAERLVPDTLDRLASPAKKARVAERQ